MMKNIKNIALILFAGLAVYSCDKYESKINGQAVYLDENDNQQYPAAFATISKCIIDHDTLKKITSVRADHDGNFIFEFVTKGKCFLYARFIIDDSVVYTGLSGEISPSGENKITQNLTLERSKEEEIKDSVSN